MAGQEPSGGASGERVGGRTDAFGWVVGLLDVLGSSGTVGPAEAVYQCPAHEDSHPSLAIGRGADGKVLLHCRAGCSFDDVVDALGIPAHYLRKPPSVEPENFARATRATLTFPRPAPRATGSPESRGFTLEAIHDYGRDDHGIEHRLLRYRKGAPGRGAKQLTWETHKGGVWEPGLYGTPTSALPLYRERDIRIAVSLGEPVLLVESESSVDALKGLYATTWAGGASTVPLARIAAVLGGYDRLVVIPDNDAAGLAALGKLQAANLAPHVLLPHPGEDAGDLYQRLGLAKLEAHVIAELHRASASTRAPRPAPTPDHVATPATRDRLAPVRHPDKEQRRPSRNPTAAPNPATDSSGDSSGVVASRGAAPATATTRAPGHPAQAAAAALTPPAAGEIPAARRPHESAAPASPRTASPPPARTARRR